MCGRYTLRTPPTKLLAQFGREIALPQPRYNISPTQMHPVLRGTEREVAWLRWGLQSSMASKPLLLARSETVTQLPSFRESARERRCLVPADGFYERDHGGKYKQQYFIHRHDDGPLAFAGIWEGDGFAILTIHPNELVAKIHDRMPVILPEAIYEAWLDPRADWQDLEPALVPFPSDQLRSDPVSDRANHPRHDDPECLRPVKLQPTLF